MSFDGQIEMRQRLKLLVAYDGAHFAGWQSQKHGKTVQDHLEQAFHGLTGKHVRVHGAGRTDAGVHALAQCAHVDVDHRLAPERWTAALNSCLPAQLRILRCQRVGEDFHARTGRPAVNCLLTRRAESKSIRNPGR